MPPSPTAPDGFATSDYGTQAPGACDAKCDVGSGGNRTATGSAATVKSPNMQPSFASVVSSPGAGTTKSPLSTKSIHAQDHSTQNSQPPPASSPSSVHAAPNTSLGDISLENRNKTGKVTRVGSGVSDNSVIAYKSPKPASGLGAFEASQQACSPRSSDFEGEIHESSDEGLEEDSESSDVEIYLDTVELDDSASRMHVYGNSVTDSSNISTTSNTAGQDHPSHHPSQVYAQGLHHHSMTTGADLINDRNYLTTRDHGPQPQHGQQQVFLQTGASGNHSRGLGVSSISQDTDSSNFNGAATNNSLSTLATTNLSHSTFPSSQHHHGLFVPHSYNTGSTATVVGSRQTPMPGAPIYTTVPLPDMDPSDIQQQNSYGLSHSLSSTSSMQLAVESATIDLANLSLPQRSGLGTGIADSHQASRQMGISGMMTTSQSQAAFGSATNYSTNASFDRPSPPSSAPLNAPLPTSVPESQFGGSESNSGSDDASFRTPNVYINGLPPHFPEDELFNLASEFGPIRSVRTFTRHVRDSESGYGFVLFENVDDAERCIISLRKFRNLHPTFSKQIHKIPGTNFATGPSTSSSSIWHSSVSSENLSSNATFKAKMESLQDPSSTNLYIEGLPLSIDEPTLAVLVTPHRVVSSRFFQTRLSNPPRIIAFVRLETREGAEEVIERLHGRMVRGMNDTGSRISVRFADTSEQRELRRTERNVQQGDVSPARLTIAQASLLNLHGQDLRPSSKIAASQSQTSLNHTGTHSFPASASVPEFPSHKARRYGQSNPNPPVIGSTGLSTFGSDGLGVDYSRNLANRTPVRVSGDLRSVSPYSMQQGYGTSFSEYTNGLAQGAADHSQTLNDTFRPSGAQYRTNGFYDPLESGEAGVYGHGQLYQGSIGSVQGRVNGGLNNAYPQQLQHDPASHSLDDLNLRQYVHPSPIHTRSGYTATEEYIMRTHTDSGSVPHQQYDLGQQERHRPAPLDLGHSGGMNDPSNPGSGIRGYRFMMSPGAFTSMGALSGFNTGFSNGRRTAGLAEDAFHGHTASTSTARTARDPGSAPPSFTTMQTAYNVPRPNGSDSPLPSSLTADHDPQASSPTFSSSMSMTSPNPNEVVSAYHEQASAAHARSTTLPQQRQPVPGRGPRGHLSHSSMSIPKPNAGTPQHASVARLGGHSGLDAALGGVIYESGEQSERKGTRPDSNGSSRGTSSSPKQAVASSLMKHRQSTAFVDVDQPTDSPMSASSSLISPTLTFSTQTPSTLSPATPFFGSFSNHLDGFEKMTPDHSHSGSQGKLSIDATADVGVTGSLKV